VYRRVGGHAYGHAYSGPIGAVLAPAMLGVEAAPDLPFASTLCGACRDVCPVRIDIPALLLDLRARVMRELQPSGGERRLIGAWRRVAGSRRLYALATKLARVGTGLLARYPRALRMAPPLAAWAKARGIPRLAARSFHERRRDLASPRISGPDGPGKRQ
jgi:L-lactate dehydrogenase complex protein LldF